MGAPWLDPWRLAATLEAERLPGVRFRSLFFRPTFQKHAGKLCGGVQVHVTDRARFRSFPTYLALIHHARAQDPEAFAWRQPPYEYEFEKLPFDILCGGNAIRGAIEAGRSPLDLAADWRRDQRRFEQRRRPFLLY